MKEAPVQPNRPWELVVLRGTDSAAARVRAQALLSSIGTEADSLFDVAARADRMGRGEPVQLAGVASSLEDCVDLLHGICAGDTNGSGVVARSQPVVGKVAFLFSDPRGERPRIPADLLAHFSQLRAALLAEPAMASWILSAAGRGDPVQSGQEQASPDPRSAQPARAIMAVALTRLLQEYGVFPEAAAGFGSGELSALWLAGSVPEWELVRLSKVRAESSFAWNGIDGSVFDGSPFEAALRDVALSAPMLPVWSNVTARRYPEEVPVIASLLSRQLTWAVDFEKQIRDMYREGVRVFIEIGHGSRLTEDVELVLGGTLHLAVAVNGDGAQGVRSFLMTLAKLLVAGVPVATETLFARTERGLPVRSAARRPATTLVAPADSSPNETRKERTS